MLDLVDSVVDDVAGVGPELGGITAILGRDVNITDLDANIQVRVRVGVDLEFKPG